MRALRIRLVALILLVSLPCLADEGETLPAPCC